MNVTSFHHVEQKDWEGNRNKATVMVSMRCMFTSDTCLRVILVSGTIRGHITVFERAVISQSFSLTVPTANSSYRSSEHPTVAILYIPSIPLASTHPLGVYLVHFIIETYVFIEIFLIIFRDRMYRGLSADPSPLKPCHLWCHGSGTARKAGI